MAVKTQNTTPISQCKAVNFSSQRGHYFHDIYVCMSVNRWRVTKLCSAQTSYPNDMQSDFDISLVIRKTMDLKS